MTYHITPELIPHADFHKGKWLLPVERPEWYYFMKRRNQNHIAAKSFITSVDKPLRKLVKFLHGKGIRTTPSCAGHHFSERNLERVYDNLEKDKADINGNGLKLKDVETGKVYLFKNKNYTLPWSRADFVSKATKYQLNGVIGLRINKRARARKRILQLQLPGATIVERDSIVFIHTRMNGDTTGNNHTWARVTKAIKRAFTTNSIARTLTAASPARIAA